MKYDHALSEIRELIIRAPDRQEALAAVVDYLPDHFSNYTWVGIYWVEGNDLVLGPWKGPEATEHTRIPIGKGVCGAAAASGKTELVPDISLESRYLACFPYTRSEIVVPIVSDRKVVGEIDIDSNQLNGFSAEDARFLEEIASLLAGNE